MSLSVVFEALKRREAITGKPVMRRLVGGAPRQPEIAIREEELEDVRPRLGPAVRRQQVASAVELRFDVAASSLDEAVRAR